MEIIHIILGKANPDRMNGVNKVVHQLATKQQEASCIVSVWGITKDKKINYEYRNFETELFIKNKNPFSVPLSLKKAILKKNKNTIYHIHGGWIPLFSSLSKFLKRHKKSFVITPHGAYNKIAINKNYIIKKFYFELFEKKLLENANKIHCIGKSEVDGVISLFKTGEKVVLIPYGFDMKEQEISLNKDKKNIVFGFVGRLDIFTKGLDTLLDAFTEFVRVFPNAKLWIIGDSNEKNTLEKLIDLRGISKKVILFGSKFGKEKETLLDLMDVFVHPSRNEGLPVSVIEAASLGLPCLVTDTTNIGHLIEKYNAGINIYSQESDDLYRAMYTIYKIWLNEKEFFAMRQNALSMVKESFNWDCIVQKLKEELYTI